MVGNGGRTGSEDFGEVPVLNFFMLSFKKWPESSSGMYSMEVSHPWSPLGKLEAGVPCAVMMVNALCNAELGIKFRGSGRKRVAEFIHVNIQQDADDTASIFGQFIVQSNRNECLNAESD